MSQASGELWLYKCTEEQPVTLQIALIGSDGWVLASDRNARSPFGNTSLTTKIRYGAEWACSFWGDECAEIVCQRIVKGLKSGGISLIDPSLDDRLQQLANEVWQSEHDSESSVPEENRLSAERERRGVLLMQRDRPSQIIDLSIARESLIHPIETKAVKGDPKNFAVFFTEYYYKTPALMTVSSLKRLAAHTILTSRHLATRNIDGLQIVSCENGQIAESDKDELEQLTNRSQEIDTGIRNAIS